MIIIIANFLITIFIFLNIFLILRHKSNVFVTLYLIFYTLYVHICPTIVSFYNNKQEQYLTMQIIYFIFFAIPIIVFSSFNFKTKFSIKPLIINKNIFLHNIVLYFLYALPIFNYIILVNNNFIYKRLGEETIFLLSDMTYIERIVIKLYDIYSIIITASLFYLTIIYKDKKYKYLFYFWLISSSFLFIVNSKQSLILLFLILLGLYFTKRQVKLKLKHILYVSVLFYLVKTTNDLRYNITLNSNGSITVDYSFLIPFANSKNTTYDENDIIYFRLNGVDLSSDFYTENGFFNFDFDYFVHFYYMNIDPVFGSGDYMKLAKSNAFTTTKILLQRKYLGINRTDHYSCVLTDIFGAFGVLGILFLSIFLSFLFLAVKNLLINNNTYINLIGIFLSISFLNFESEITGNIIIFFALFFPTIYIYKSLIKYKIN